jgi:hypothetical protein
MPDNTPLRSRSWKGSVGPCRLSLSLPDAHFRLGQAYARLGQKDVAQHEFQLHQRLYEQYLAEDDKQRSEIEQFVYSMKGTSAGR